MGSLYDLDFEPGTYNWIHNVKYRWLAEHPWSSRFQFNSEKETSHGKF